MSFSKPNTYLDCYGGPGMSNKIAVIKGVIYALIMGTVAIVGIVENGNPTYIVLAFLLGALLIFGVEINTISLGNWLEIDFTTRGKNQNRENED
jgi:hypothetical protein